MKRNANSVGSTFRQLYEAERDKPTPSQAFVTKVAELTCKSPQTVRMWIMGVQSPDPLCQRVIAEHFHTSAETLFPASKS